MARFSTIASITLSCGFLASAALADDLTPPPWRFGPTTTFQHWDFSSGPTGGPPDAGLFNPFGTPIFTPSTGSTWLPTFAGRSDVWSVGGAAPGGGLSFDIPNHFMPGPHVKDLWLQITYFDPTGGTASPGVTVASGLGPFTLIGGPSVTPLPGGWIHELTRWQFQACPQSERVSIFPQLPGVNLVIDQVVIDTNCQMIPAPGSLALLGFGGLIAGHRRRRS